MGIATDSEAAFDAAKTVDSGTVTIADGEAVPCLLSSGIEVSGTEGPGRLSAEVSVEVVTVSRDMARPNPGDRAQLEYAGETYALRVDPGGVLVGGGGAIYTFNLSK